MGNKLYNINNWDRQGLELEDYPYIGEINCDATVGEVLEVDNKFFSVDVYNYSNKAAGVREIEIDLEPEDKEYEDNLVCPYCGYVHEDSFDISEDSGEHECSGCGAVMAYERVVTVEYRSFPVRPPKIVTASWLNKED